MKSMKKLMEQYVNLGLGKWIEDGEYKTIKCFASGAIIRLRHDIEGIPVINR